MIYTKKIDDYSKLEIELDENGFGCLMEIYAKGDVYEVERITDLWINYEGFDGVEYDEKISITEENFLKEIFKNTRKL